MIPSDLISKIYANLTIFFFNSIYFCIFKNRLPAILKTVNIYHVTQIGTVS